MKRLSKLLYWVNIRFFRDGLCLLFLNKSKIILLSSFHNLNLPALNFDKQKKNDSSSHENIEGAFEDQLLSYHNNMLFLPGLSEFFKDSNSKFWRFFGEEIILETSAQLHVLANGDTLIAQVLITDYRLLLVPSDQAYLSTKHFRSDYFSIPLSSINHFYKGFEKKNQSSNALYISTKLGCKFRLIFGVESTSDLIGVSDILEQKLPFSNINNYFAFTFYTEYPHLEREMKGWSVYNLTQEFSRQGLNFGSSPSQESPNFQQFSFQKLKNLHANGLTRICESYPEEVIVPKLLTVDELIGCSKFRTKSRFPALAYCYKLPDIKESFVTIWRSSQCRHGLGLYNHRSDEDEMYLRLIGDPCNKEMVKEGDISVHIYDARPYLNAIANKMNGKGYENITYYKNAEIFFLNIDNIHGVRENYKRLMHQMNESFSGGWVNNSDSNGWLIAIESLLAGAIAIVEKSIQKAINVLIHCSDGWDRTTQLVSLVQLMLDPYFRTIEGFQVLIEKDWISFGHMFKTRNGWRANNPFEEDKRSPVFIQFLDSVHQLLSQFPYEFEFNLKFLTDLAYYSRTGLFGNFLCDNEAEMIQYKIKEKTTSIWSFINSNKEIYTEPLRKTFAENLRVFKSKIIPKLGFLNLRLWKEFFFFYTHPFLEKAKFPNVEISNERDLYELALRYQMSISEQLKHENEILMRRIKELTAKEDVENVEDDFNISVNAEKNSRISKSKFEMEFLIVKEKEQNERERDNSTR